MSSHRGIKTTTKSASRTKPNRFKQNEASPTKGNVNITRGTNGKLGKKNKSLGGPKNKCSNIEESSELVSPVVNGGDSTSEQQRSIEEETNLDRQRESEEELNEEASLIGSKQARESRLLPKGWEEHSDRSGVYYLQTSTGLIQRVRPSESEDDQMVSICQDDEEINAAKNPTPRDELYDENEECEDDELTAALTIDDTSESTFVVYPLGSCELDETELVSTASTKVIQKCILRLSTRPMQHETNCWGLDQASPVGMTLFDDYIQFVDLKTSILIRSQPIHTFKAWAVDDDNKFALVIEDRPYDTSSPRTDGDSDSCLLARAPVLMCYVFHSIDDDDMNGKVASKLIEAINRHKQSMNDRLERSNRIQQMVIQDPALEKQITKSEEEDEDETLAVNSDEMTISVRYIGETVVNKPTGIDMLNLAIDKCLADLIQRARESSDGEEDTNLDDVIVTSNSSASILQQKSPLVDAKLHISPSSVIVENEHTGDIIVECRIRYLTFIGISKRDIRWCGFIMQSSSKSKAFIAHAFECHPTAARVCEAIQQSCMRMYEKVVKDSRKSREPEAMSIIPSRTTLRNTLAKTLSRMRLSSGTIRY